MKIHWKKYIILIGVATSVYGILAVSAAQISIFLSEYPSVVGAINFYRTDTAVITTTSLPKQSVSRGWRNFGNEAFDVFTPEYCKNITVSTGSARDIFIPTRTSLEWDAFKTSNALTTFGISISSCASLPYEGCNLLSGTVCGDTCPEGSMCLNTQATYSNECEMVMNEAKLIGPGACLADGPCNPDSGPVVGAAGCTYDPKTGNACTDGPPNCIIYDNECAMEAAGASSFFCGGSEI